MPIKAAFVAGIILIIIIINKIIGCYFVLSTWAAYSCYIICLIIVFIVLGTKAIDKWMEAKNIENFGNYLTVISVAFFFVDSICNGFSQGYSELGIKILMTSFGGIAIVGAFYLLFVKHK